MKKQVEEFRDIPGYEGYQVSNFGRVKSFKHYIEGVLKNSRQHNGYYITSLSINNKKFTKNIHQLVAMAFLDHKPNRFKIVVDHINGDKLDNNIENLQLISNRENCSKDRKNKSSIYTGVCFDKSKNKWISYIQINGKIIHLGVFNSEKEASEYYQNALKAIENNEDIIIKKPTKTSLYKGVCWKKINNKWASQIMKNGKKIHLGYFNTELEAHNAYQNKLKELQNEG